MEIIGHQKTIDYLITSFESSNSVQAYLFVGPQAVGKKHLAQWLTYYLNCQGTDQNKLFSNSKGGQKPCFSCQPCTSIEKLIHPDCFFLQSKEDKHKISIEQIRLLQKKLGQAPAQGSYTIAIIDNAHEMSLGASNALLKTLEEPSKTSIIFLISHLPQNLPATIRSRCQIIEFSKVFDVSPEINNDHLWAEAKGLPGAYQQLKSDPKEVDYLSKERNFFLQTFQQSKGKRLKALEPLFSSAKKHKQSKDQWQNRLNLWKDTLREIAMLQLRVPGSRKISAGELNQLSLPSIVAAIDELEEIKGRITQNANVRIQMEAFAISNLL